jgi:hypothetical protein
MMLTDTEMQIIDMAAASYKYQGARESDIQSTFGNVTHFYQRLNRIIDTEAALAYDPYTVNRIRGTRRSRARS